MLAEGWKTKKLRDILSSVDAGVSVNGEDRATKSDEYGVLKISAVTEGIFRPHENKAIRSDELARAAINPSKDCILISRSNTEALVGASAYVSQDHKNLFLPDKLWQLRASCDEQTHMRWLYYWLASDSTRSALSKLATGTSGSMKNISKSQLLALDIKVPPIHEQRRIAHILSTWDQAIATTERLLANSRRQKMLLSQQVLTGKARLAGFTASGHKRNTPYGSVPVEWDYPRIGDVAAEISDKLGDSEPYPVLSCTKHHGLVDSLKYFKKQVFSVNTSTYKVAPWGCFVYATNHIDEGSIGYQNLYEAGLISPMYTVFKTSDKVVDAYLFALLKTEHYRQIFASAINASVDRRGSLRWKDFQRIHIPLPPVEEQQAIATMLAQAGREVALIKNQLDLLREEKSALMSQLLTGKRRVRLQADEAESA
ncbi:restriction endonuclease subunit S [Xanthomonas campestris]|uniref:restriction endonuclease subunit S n=1 Tax=Xanthomonas campestris TaxID=339 RepID=UPI0008A64377|nr:restriction endonuclease subunit S [Xanthomonas campestris]MEB1150033.1 restriction endonuclease subunit S [Xanthomonas campestris pv. campestris]MCC5096605.1 restriction endonuclease subunit S [Xanthomonas campestris]MEA9582444.1 restriction endonuclease subunit S [Xanthomonas campestris]MEA9590860.1 restriction endonuclease subunit S [Xanthomonas campestris]MEA9622341.1 restriction endonuclease subunit S [Xanthomonas campestris]